MTICTNMRSSLAYDLSNAIAGLLDDGFMLLYRYTRRISNLLIALVPLMALLVGSCKTSTVDNTYSVLTEAQEVQMALFPDRAGFHGDHYVPAASYVSRARKFIEREPQTLMMLSQDEVGYILGKPSFHRHDADAQVWQYKTANCVIDFYFYGEKQVSYIDARHKNQTPASASDESSCLSSIDATI